MSTETPPAVADPSAVTPSGRRHRALPPRTATTANTATSASTVNLVLLHEGLYRLPPSTDPQVVFASVADLLAMALCDEASADVFLGARLARWQQNPPLTDGVPVRGRSRPPDGRPDDQSVTVHVGGLPAESDGWTGDLDYVVALTCGWHDQQEPTEALVALIKIVARHAAAIVHQAQQAELIRAQEIRIGQLQKDR